jgi:heme/copper-type cytochrome/quinol oxidase subunit 1
LYSIILTLISFLESPITAEQSGLSAAGKSIFFFIEQSFFLYVLRCVTSLTKKIAALTGIVVGLVSFLIGVGVVLFLILFVKRRKQKRQNQKPTSSPTLAEQTPSEKNIEQNLGDVPLGTLSGIVSLFPSKKGSYFSYRI